MHIRYNLFLYTFVHFGIKYVAKAKVEAVLRLYPHTNTNVVPIFKVCAVTRTPTNI